MAGTAAGTGAGLDPAAWGDFRIVVVWLAGKNATVTDPTSARRAEIGFEGCITPRQPGPFRPDAKQSAAYNRGAYLVSALAHCGECHTPRNVFGAASSSGRLSGTADGPNGQPVPNITPDPTTGLGSWEKGDLVALFETGITPEQSKVKGAMREVIENGLRYLTDADMEAIADYLLVQKPIGHAVARKQ
jgi:mono/diheme cytochrome c family protein